jgi:hypothetical protein
VVNFIPSWLPTCWMPWWNSNMSIILLFLLLLI